MVRAVQSLTPPEDTSNFDALLAASAQERPGEERLDRMVRQALPSMLEQRHSRGPG